MPGRSSDRVGASGMVIGLAPFLPGIVTELKPFE